MDWCPCLQADTQIYNKVLSLIEDWSIAISLPAYSQEFSSLKVNFWTQLPPLFQWHISSCPRGRPHVLHTLLTGHCTSAGFMCSI